MNLYCAQPVIDAEVYRLLGEDIPRLLREGKAQEISINADGRIRIDDGGPYSAQRHKRNCTFSMFSHRDERERSAHAQIIEESATTPNESAST